jgi:hypothetical protein
MANPAASSAAEFIRLPVDSCCIELATSRALRVNAFWEINDLMLVLMTDME